GHPDSKEGRVMVEPILRRPRRLATITTAIAVAIGGSPRVLAQADDQSIALVVQAGRPLSMALDERIRLTRVGPPIAGTLVEPVYVFDRIVIPVGTRVFGHVTSWKRPRRAHAFARS